MAVNNQNVNRVPDWAGYNKKTGGGLNLVLQSRASTRNHPHIRQGFFDQSPCAPPGPPHE